MVRVEFEVLLGGDRITISDYYTTCSCNGNRETLESIKNTSSLTSWTVKIGAEFNLNSPLIFFRIRYGHFIMMYNIPLYNNVKEGSIVCILT